MQAGFAMVEAGLTRAKNAINIMMKNLMDFSMGSLAFWAIGFGIMFGVSKTGWFGTSGVCDDVAWRYDCGRFWWRQCLSDRIRWCRILGRACQRNLNRILYIILPRAPCARGRMISKILFPEQFQRSALKLSGCKGCLGYFALRLRGPARLIGSVQHIRRYRYA
jgi:hypothetical protein